MLALSSQGVFCSHEPYYVPLARDRSTKLNILDVVDPTLCNRYHQVLLCDILCGTYNCQVVFLQLRVPCHVLCVQYQFLPRQRLFYIKPFGVAYLFLQFPSC